MKNRHPFAINILKLKEYNFDITKIEEVVFFEWLVIKRISFGSDEFFYQERRVIEEVGIKRTRLKTTKDFFCSLGLGFDTCNMFNTGTYNVNIGFIKGFIDHAIKEEYRKSKFESICNYHFKTDKPLSRNDKKNVELLIDELNEVYNKRRRMHSDKSESIEYAYTGLPINERSYKQLNELQKVYDDNIIINSFTSYCDEVIIYKDRVVKVNMTNHFSSYDFVTKKFEVFERHLHNFNLNYIVKK